MNSNISSPEESLSAAKKEENPDFSMYKLVRTHTHTQLTVHCSVVALKNWVCCIVSIFSHTESTIIKAVRKKSVFATGFLVLGAGWNYFFKQLWPWLRKNVLSSLENCEELGPITSPRFEVLGQGISVPPPPTPRQCKRRNGSQIDFAFEGVQCIMKLFPPFSSPYWEERNFPPWIQERAAPQEFW